MDPTATPAPPITFVEAVTRFNAAIDAAKGILDLVLGATRGDPTGSREHLLSDLNDHVWVEAHDLILRAAAAHFNAWVRADLARRDDREDYKRKKELASAVNLFARTFGVALRAPDAAAPCVLFAVGSRDGFGRYVLEARETKTRTGSYKTLADLLPVELVSAPARAEHYVPRSQDWCREAGRGDPEPAPVAGDHTRSAPVTGPTSP